MTPKITEHPAETMRRDANSIRTLTCCCCGELTRGRQWHNRDTGFGLCGTCALRIAERETPEYMHECYGIRGEHYGLTRIG